ncbi:MAG: hypothetical protein N5P05_001259 [Chroococcopsis gigantea SAG 12.99]|nr:hypothetical protein [Chroococcopsis gigantea SAG 12.99]
MAFLSSAPETMLSDRIDEIKDWESGVGSRESVINNDRLLPTLYSPLLIHIHRTKDYRFNLRLKPASKPTAVITPISVKGSGTAPVLVN